VHGGGIDVSAIQFEAFKGRVFGHAIGDAGEHCIVSEILQGFDVQGAEGRHLSGQIAPGR